MVFWVCWVGIFFFKSTKFCVTCETTMLSDQTTTKFEHENATRSYIIPMWHCLATSSNCQVQISLSEQRNFSFNPLCNSQFQEYLHCIAFATHILPRHTRVQLDNANHGLIEILNWGFCHIYLFIYWCDWKMITTECPFNLPTSNQYQWDKIRCYNMLRNWTGCVTGQINSWIQWFFGKIYLLLKQCSLWIKNV